jgi:predicted HicB family RNase H-like nuclease
MPTDDREVWVQLATRIPKSLHRVLKLHCVQTDTSVMAFVVGALQEKLARDATRARRATPARRKP